MMEETFRSRTRGSAFLVISLILCATVVWGFWQSYFWPLMTSAVDRLWVVHVHAAVFVGWMTLLTTQVVAVSRGHMRFHKRLGIAGMGYAILVLAVGLVVSVVVPVSGARAGNFSSDVAGLVAVYLVTDMLFFGGFMVAAMIYRARPAIHKRLIVCATIALTTAAVGRELPAGSPSFYAVWLAPLFVLVGVDLVTLKRPHIVSITGLAVLSLAFFKNDLLAPLPATLSLGRLIVSPWL